MPYAYATLLTSDGYLPGALILGHALKETGTPHQVTCVVTPETVSANIIPILQQTFDHVALVPVLRSGDPERLGLLGRPELDVTFTKIHLWNPSVLPYERVVFMDADAMPLRNVDELFDTLSGDIAFSAAPDQGWPDCFNSGVFVLKPSTDVHLALQQHAEAHGSFDGGDQGLLNSFFSNWTGGPVPPSHPVPPPSARIPFIYNVTPTAIYSYLPAFVHYRADIAIVHFIGEVKPWMYDRFTDGSVVPRGPTIPQTLEIVQKWWSIFDSHHIGRILNQVGTLRGRFSGWNFKSASYPYNMLAPALPPQSEQPLPSSLTTAQEPQAPPDFGSYRVDWDSREFTRRQKRLTDGAKMAKLTIDTDEDNAELQRALQSPLSAGGTTKSQRPPSAGGAIASSLAMTPISQAAAQQKPQQQQAPSLSSSAPQVNPIGFGAPPKATSPSLSRGGRETAGASALAPPLQRSNKDRLYYDILILVLGVSIGVVLYRFGSGGGN
ncbi:hypothetical protein SeMB42_g01880 [Synchytrium endobioticum]|uniref:glycogenin glucosyltransferase n=1 Tax=Synchytrium endobioticum TaxID=286115 RepID=A0A507DL33_9FUNG|nr:hypothetical protein SeLEV6574_g03247 [Synchytrium endobioticum]TPX51578.1 hypothetical protein SeMB42_g01880 [Synchytrium endobioticum]